MDYLRRHALAFVNFIRRNNGLAPLTALPAGLTRHPTDCAMGRAVGGDPYVGSRVLRSHGRDYRMPWQVRLFRLLFDWRKYPELRTLRPTRTGIEHLDFSCDDELAAAAAQRQVDS